MVRTVNDTDRAIIRLLQQDARMSYAEVSRATGTPESTVRRRMDRLQERGVIQFAMVAEPSRLGYDLRAMIGLRVEMGRLQAVAEHLRDMNEVTFAAFLTGNFDIMVHVVVESQEDLVGLLTEKLTNVDGIVSTETFVMPWVIKPMTSWVLPEHESGRQPGNPFAARTEHDERSARGAAIRSSKPDMLAGHGEAVTDDDEDGDVDDSATIDDRTWTTEPAADRVNLLEPPRQRLATDVRDRHRQS